MNLATLPLLRLARSPRAWLWSGGWSAFVVGAAVLARRHGAPHAVDQALDLYASLALPFLTFGLAGVAVGQESLAGSGRALVALGASAGRVALGTVVATMAACALLAGVLGALVVVVAHGAGDPPVMADAQQTFAFGALAGAAYGAYFMVGASLLGGVWGRGLFLVLDRALGADASFAALLTPRGHLRNLLGGEAPLEALPWESAVALAMLVLVFTAYAARRASRIRV